MIHSVTRFIFATAAVYYLFVGSSSFNRDLPNRMNFYMLSSLIFILFVILLELVELRHDVKKHFQHADADKNE